MKAMLANHNVSIQRTRKKVKEQTENTQQVWRLEQMERRRERRTGGRSRVSSKSAVKEKEKE